MRSLLVHPLAVAFFTLVALVFSVSMYLSAKSQSDGKEVIAALEESVARQQMRVSELEEQAALAQDPFVQEKIQRDERLQQKPGEILLQLPPITVPSPTPQPTPVQLTPWQEWRALLWRKL